MDNETIYREQVLTAMLELEKKATDEFMFGMDVAHRAVMIIRTAPSAKESADEQQGV